MPYPDEIFYSVLARREAQMCYPSYKGVLRETFGCENLLATLEFPSHLGALLHALPASHPCADFQGLERLTLLPWYAPFLPLERSAMIREAMHGVGGRDCWNRAGISSSRIKALTHLRYCPACLCADQSAGRTPYWRRLHQLVGIEVCPEHQVQLAVSDVKKRNYRFLLPAPELLEVPARPVSNANLIGLARLGSALLSREWPVLNPAQLRRNYLVLLEGAGYVNNRRQVKMAELLRDVYDFYPRWFLERVGCRKPHWLGHLVRSRASIQQPIRHLLLVNFLGASLEELFAPKPVVLDFAKAENHPNLACMNFLCSEHGKQTSEFIKEERMNVMGGVVEAYRCESCGQVQGRCCVGHERTWVRDFGPLWRERLSEHWNDPAMSLRAIAKALRVSCDAVSKNALKSGLPLVRHGRRPMSVKAYAHLLTPKADRLKKKVAVARKRWLALKARNSEMGMRGLREKLPGVYMILWRYDRQWLEANLPPRQKRKQAVDWGRRDLMVCKRLESAAKQLSSLTPNRLAQSAGVTGWIPSRLARLPKALKLWLELTDQSDAGRN